MATPKKLHIAMFPWLAFGHMLPFFELAKNIARKGHNVSFISTPKNIKRLPEIPPNLSPLMNFVSLALPHQANLPHEAEATTDLPFPKIQYLKIAYDNLQNPLSQILQTSSPDWIIYDGFAYWSAPIARELGISCMYFSIFPAWSICFCGSSTTAMINGEDPRTKAEDFTVPPQWVPFPSNVAFRLHEAKKLLVHFEEDDSGVSDLFRAGSAIAGCDVMAIKSSMELEPEWLSLLAKLHGKPIVPIGLLPPLEKDYRENTTEHKAWLVICKWLEKQKTGSVIYVALGSEINPSQEDITELALGLELSGLPFFWSLRKQHSSVELPEGFQERVKERGVVWTSWAPQLKILSHDSVGAFLTHCGLNSIIEALCHGRPLILLAFVMDHGLASRVFAEKKAGIEIKRKEEDGKFRRESVAETVKVVIDEEEGRVYREKAMEMRNIIADKELENEYTDNFIKLLENYRQISTA
ncbi:putative UDP-rhamnose:rhamnosyltransferase 1 [Mangifera indica]|uniref:putative UDP-rhamnose:rhamnosyltransferase 1 n=1 Tax=Mangifera indica TaxID=29780 RepID=UPI001CFB84AF|nr:putative UDP-rhamnose:rhamnosyltransferase 1 [Mangifera indica]